MVMGRKCQNWLKFVARSLFEQKKNSDLLFSINNKYNVCSAIHVNITVLRQKNSLRFPSSWLPGPGNWFSVDWFFIISFHIHILQTAYTYIALCAIRYVLCTLRSILSVPKGLCSTFVWIIEKPKALTTLCKQDSENINFFVMFSIVFQFF